MSADLVAFLRARLDEDEQAAEAADDDAEWTVESRKKAHEIEAIKSLGVTRSGVWVVTGEDGSYGIADAVDTAHAQHIARHDPARVLAEVDAKRQILDLYECVGSGTEVRPYVALKRALSMLALPYADHPDYRKEWRPLAWRHRTPPVPDLPAEG